MIEIRNVSCTHKGSRDRTIANISLSLEAGERVCVIGPNAGGKSTLVELISGVKTFMEGNIATDGEVGFVSADPRSTFVSSLVFDEVAFGLRCKGMPRKTVKARTLAALERCGIRRLANSSTIELSSTQQMLVGFAATLALEPQYLVFDDIFSMLDSTTAKNVAALVDDLVQRGVGILEVTHSLERAMGAHRVAVLGKGDFVWSGQFAELIARDDLLESAGLESGALSRLLHAVSVEGFQFAPGATPEDVVSFISANRLGYKIAHAVTPRRSDGRGESEHVLALESASVIYGEKAALKDATLSVGDELVVIVGPEGSGKTTLAMALAGVLQLDEGSSTFDGKRIRPGNVGIAMKRPGDQFLAKTVREDIALGAISRGVPKKQIDDEVKRATKALGVTDLLDRKISELSSGQARLVALAGVFALQPDAYVLDEPLASLDASGRAKVKSLVRRIRAEHKPVAIVTSDAEDWLDLASRVIFTRDGSIAYDCDAAAAQTRTQPYLSWGLEPPLPVSVRSLAGMAPKRGEARG